MLKKLRSLLKKNSSEWIEDNLEIMVRHFGKPLLNGTEQERTRATEVLLTLMSIYKTSELIHGPVIPSADLAIKFSDKAVDLMREEYPEAMNKLVEEEQQARESFLEELAQIIPKRQSDISAN